MDHGQQHEPARGNGTKSRMTWVLIGFLVVAGYFLVTEHRAHLFGWLSSYGIWLLLLACPLMHLFGHGHGGHGGEASKPEPGAKKTPEPSEHQHH